MVYDRIPGVDENFRLPPDVMMTIIPPGSFLDYGGDVAPAGFAICDGAEVPRTGAYAGVFAALGEKFGDGDGSTTFNLPDFRGRVRVGYDVTQTEFNLLGKTGGSKSKNIDHTHVKGLNMSTSPNAAGAYVISQGNNTLGMNSNQDVEILQPYATVNVLVKL